jgi:hypothetical protein
VHSFFASLVTFFGFSSDAPLLSIIKIAGITLCVLHYQPTALFNAYNRRE